MTGTVTKTEKLFTVCCFLLHFKVELKTFNQKKFLQF